MLPSLEAELCQAVQKRGVELAEKLLREGVNPNSDCGDKSTPLVHAAYTGEADLVRLLLELGATVTPYDKDGNSAFVAAISSPRGRDLPRELKERLLTNTMLSTRVVGESLLGLAIDEIDADAVQLLLERGASVDEPTGQSPCQTPLMLAAEKNIRGFVETLINAGADWTKGCNGLRAVDVVGLQSFGISRQRNAPDEEIVSLLNSLDSLSPSSRCFRVGSTRIELYRAQGKPNGMANNGSVAYFGSSSVYLENGRVVRWSVGSSPLRVCG